MASTHLNLVSNFRLVGILWVFVQGGSTVKVLSSHSVLGSLMILSEMDLLDQSFFLGNVEKGPPKLLYFFAFQH